MTPAMLVFNCDRPSDEAIIQNVLHSIQSKTPSGFSKDPEVLKNAETDLTTIIVYFDCNNQEEAMSINNRCNQMLYDKKLMSNRPKTQTIKKDGNEKSKHENGDCFIATAVYEDYNHPQVIKLRRFRDDVLRHNYIGEQFIKYYYAYGPTLAILPKRISYVKKALRLVLDKI